MITVMKLGYSYLDAKRCKCGIFHHHDRIRTAKDQKESHGIIRRETWGFSFSLKDAQKYVRRNALDMCEAGYYDIAVIEAAQEPGLETGRLLGKNNEWWYKWKGPFPRPGRNKIGGFKPCCIPKSLKGIVHFWSCMIKTAGQWRPILVLWLVTILSTKVLWSL